MPPLGAPSRAADFEEAVRLAAQAGAALARSPPFICAHVIRARAAIRPKKTPTPWPPYIRLESGERGISWGMDWMHRTCPFCALPNSPNAVIFKCPETLEEHLHTFHPLFTYRLQFTSDRCLIKLKMVKENPNPFIVFPEWVCGAELSFFSTPQLRKALRPARCRSTVLQRRVSWYNLGYHRPGPLKLFQPGLRVTGLTAAKSNANTLDGANLNAYARIDANSNTEGFKVLGTGTSANVRYQKSKGTGAEGRGGSAVGSNPGTPGSHPRSAVRVSPVPNVNGHVGLPGGVLSARAPAILKMARTIHAPVDTGRDVHPVVKGASSSKLTAPASARELAKQEGALLSSKASTVAQVARVALSTAPTERAAKKMPEPRTIHGAAKAVATLERNVVGSSKPVLERRGRSRSSGISTPPVPQNISTLLQSRTGSSKKPSTEAKNKSGKHEGLPPRPPSSTNSRRYWNRTPASTAPPSPHTSPSPQLSPSPSPLPGPSNNARLRNNQRKRSVPPSKGGGECGAAKPKPRKRARRTKSASDNANAAAKDDQAQLVIPSGPVPVNEAGLPQLTREFVADKLYHSVTNQEIMLSEFNTGADSDSEEDFAWRLRFKEDLLHDFVDMLAVEKVFMNLWNQFTIAEHRILADRDVLPAVHAFIEKYGPEVKRMKLEVVFVRHVTVLYNCGLLDSNGADEVFKHLKDTPTGTTVDTRFTYAVRMLNEERVEHRNYYIAEWNEAAHLMHPGPEEEVDEDHFNSGPLLKSVQESYAALEDLSLAPTSAPSELSPVGDTPFGPAATRGDRGSAAPSAAGTRKLSDPVVLPFSSLSPPSTCHVTGSTPSLKSAGGPAKISIERFDSLEYQRSSRVAAAGSGSSQVESPHMRSSAAHGKAPVVVRLDPESVAGRRGPVVPATPESSALQSEPTVSRAEMSDVGASLGKTTRADFDPGATHRPGYLTPSTGITRQFSRKASLKSPASRRGNLAPPPAPPASSAHRIMFATARSERLAKVAGSLPADRERNIVLSGTQVLQTRMSAPSKSGAGKLFGESRSRPPVPSSAVSNAQVNKSAQPGPAAPSRERARNRSSEISGASRHRRPSSLAHPSAQPRPKTILAGSTCASGRSPALSNGSLRMGKLEDSVIQGRHHLSNFVQVRQTSADTNISPWHNGPVPIPQRRVGPLGTLVTSNPVSENDDEENALAKEIEIIEISD